jgi:hypothetical protein
MVAKVFGVAKATLCWHCKQHRVRATSPVSNGHPAILSHAEKDGLTQYITTGYVERRPWTMTGIKDRIESIYRKGMEDTSIRHMPRRDPRVKACPGLPMEES